MRKTGCVLVVLAGTILGVPEPVLGQAERLDGRLAPEVAEEVTALADTARARPLPVEPVIQKALEGASKGASGEAIVLAVRGLISDMERARKALGSDVPSHALVLGAAVLDQGASPAELSELRVHETHPSLPAALGGLIYLLGRSVPPEASVRLTLEMLEADLPAAAFSSLQRLVEQDTRGGAAPVESARVRVRALIQAGGPLGREDGGAR